MDMEDAIMLGMKALYRSTEGKLNAATLEVGLVTLEQRQFIKLSEEEVEKYVDRIQEELKDEFTEGEEEEEDSSENPEEGSDE
jgi:proteasome alpha subunit